MAALNIERLARFVCLYHRVDCVLQVIRMNDVGGLPTFQLLECLVEIFEGRLIDALDFTGRCGDGDRRRDAVHDETKTKIAGSQCFLSAPESHDEIVLAVSPILSRFHGKRMRPSGSKCPSFVVCGSQYLSLLHGGVRKIYVRRCHSSGSRAVPSTATIYNRFLF